MVTEDIKYDNITAMEKSDNVNIDSPRYSLFLQREQEEDALELENKVNALAWGLLSLQMVLFLVFLELGDMINQ
jgi:hypothetical protein